MHTAAHCRNHYIHCPASTPHHKHCACTLTKRTSESRASQLHPHNMILQCGAPLRSLLRHSLHTALFWELEHPRNRRRLRSSPLPRETCPSRSSNSTCCSSGIGSRTLQKEGGPTQAPIGRSNSPQDSPLIQKPVWCSCKQRISDEISSIIRQQIEQYNLEVKRDNHRTPYQFTRSKNISLS